MNLDKSRKFLKEDECWFLRGHERSIGEDGSKRQGKPGPMIANSPACDMEQPAGENYAPNTFYSARTNEQYSWVYNSNGVHYIQRINGRGECQIVYHGCLDISPLPEHEITQWRAYMKIDKLCANVHGKQLIWCDGNGEIGQIDVEASIATNFFTTPFFERCADPCSYVRMCVPDPCECLTGEFVPPVPGDEGKKNNLLDVGIKLMFQWVYYDGRESIWSDPSTLFFQDTRGCFDNPVSFPRCIRVRVPIGNPLVDKIRIAYQKDGVWFLADTIDKYKKYNSSQQFWYERELAELENYSDEDCSFDYFFCNDKQCDPVDPHVINRVYNPMPRQPQGLIPIGLNEQEDQALGFYNYKQGNCQIDKSQIEKFDINLNCEDNSCQSEFVTVIVRAIIHNTTHSRNQFIYRNGGSAADSPDDPGDTAWFGGLNPALDGGFETGYDQSFNDKTRNFICYVEGTKYYAEMKQWKAHPFFTAPYDSFPVIGNMNSVHERNRWRRATRNGEFFYQEAQLKVPKGTRGFIRLASHHATGNEQNTSTFVLGILSDIHSYAGNINPSIDLTTEEIYFNACQSGTIEILKTFFIQDNAVDSGLSKKASAYHGYITDKNNLPVEGASIFVGAFLRSTTDHNGFYHFYLDPGTNDGIDLSIRVELDCYEFKQVDLISVQSGTGSNMQADKQITSDIYAAGFFCNVLQKITDCSGNPISGLRVALSGTKYKVTDGSGVAHFRIRNYSARTRSVQSILLDQNDCFQTDCNNNCHPCMPTGQSATPSCYYDKPTVTLTTQRINTVSLYVGNKGLKAGGRYPFGLVIRGNCGRISAVNEIKYIDIPKTQSKNKLSFCSFTYNGNGIVLPDWANCVDIVRGENINPFELQWVIDKIERTSDGKIKLTIQSLNDYNAKYFFKTNTIYKWLKGDRVEFIRNGDGQIFSIAAYGLLNYLTLSPFNDESISGDQNAPADFFNQLLITDDGKLDGLKEGAIIEIQRAKECSTTPVYYSICAKIPVVDGRLQMDIGTFNTFDTYFVSRQISPFPAEIFEHFSPSDFWGDNILRLSDAGRAYFPNKFENEKRFGRNLSINAPNIFNYFGDLVKIINPIDHGDITAMWLFDQRIGICISEHNNSLFEAGESLLRVGNDNVVRALSADQIVSDSEPKLSGAFGCQYPHIGSIYFGDGWASWWDVNKHNYIKQGAVSTSRYSRIAEPMTEAAESFFTQLSQQIQLHNDSVTDPLDKMRISTGFNWVNGALMVTVRTLRDSGVNNEGGLYKKRNDTIVIDPDSGDVLTMAPFTPEGYGRLDLFDGKGCAFISYLHGVPYIHPVIPTRWLEYYGVPVDWWIGITLNEGPKKQKEGLSIELQSDTMFFSKAVTTDDPKFVSEIPPIKWKRTANKWNAGFLGNKNSRGGIHNGDVGRGYEISVLLCRDNTQGLQYGTIDNNKRIVFSDIDIIAMKYLELEQSGFELNV